MKILHVVPSYIPAYRYGGPIYSVHGICRALAAQGHKVSVCTTNVDGLCDANVPLDAAVDIDGVAVRYFSSHAFRRIYYSAGMHAYLKREIKYFDLVHNHSVFLWPTWAAAREAEKNKIPYVISPRGMLVKELIEQKSRCMKIAWIKLIEKRNIEKAGAIHLTSEVEKKEFERFNFKTNGLFVVPNGVFFSDTASVTPAALSPRIKNLVSRPYILFLGRVHWVKGLDRLISAMKYVPDMRLVIAGNDEEGYQKKLNELVSSLGLKDIVEFAGPVEGFEKEALYSKASFFVLPSKSENFGNAALEAMAAGCPIIVTPEVGLSPFVSRSGGGLVANGDPLSLGEAMARLANDATLRKQMGDKAKRAVMEAFSWEDIAKKMSSIYERLAGHA